ncbi:MAG: branched-chain amino acid ABC transporter permease [Rhodocyclaceae bacterium]|nr:branched-chain amino acid ABC transporter permease [Rhodocyclaceae bacterium]
MNLVNAIVQGILIGGLYALYAAGLSLIFGVMRLVNIAHGDLIVLAAYLALSATGLLGLHPLLSLVVVVPLMAALGYVVQRWLLNATLGPDILPPLLVTFGLSVIVQNALREGYSANPRQLTSGDLETAAIALTEHLSIGVLPLLTLIAAVTVLAGLHLLFYRTALGRAFRAASDDAEIAGVMGLDTRHLYGVAMAIAFAIIAVAGVFLGMRSSFDPASGTASLIFGFEAVIIGGIGNLWGTLAGGVLLGVAQAIGAVIDPAFQILAGHIAFLAVLAVRPQGLLPKMSG